MPTHQPQQSKPRRIIGAAVVVIEEGIPSVLLAISVLLLCADVAGRYIFNSPIPSAGSIAMLCFIWITYISAGAIARRGRHIVIDVLVDAFPPRLQAATQVLVQLLVLALIGFVLFYAFDALLHTRFVEVPGLGVDRSVFTASIVIGFVLMAFYSIRDIVHALRGTVTGDFAPLQDDSDDDFSSLDASAPVGGGYEPPTSVTEAVFIADRRHGDNEKGTRA